LGTGTVEAGEADEAPLVLEEPEEEGVILIFTSLLA